MLLRAENPSARPSPAAAEAEAAAEPLGVIGTTRWRAARPRPPSAAGARSPELAELGLAFRRVFRTLNRMRGRDTHLAGSELSHAQFELLIELDERGELSAGELAAAARLSPGTVTQMLDGLAECGHVERARSESDRRVVVSRLTPAGKAQDRGQAGGLAAALGGRPSSGVGERDLRAAAEVLRAPRRRCSRRAPPREACEARPDGAESGAAGGQERGWKRRIPLL